MHNVRLKVSGQLYGGWQEIRIQRSIEQIAGKFDLRVTERWSGQDEPRPIRPGEECQILIDDQPIITGYVDDVGIDYDAESHSVNVSGRDRTGDLVDCSAPPTQWSQHTLLDGARRLAKPFGIDVKAEVDVGARFPWLTNNPGDTVFDTLDAAAKIRAVLLISDGLGGLVITRASKEPLGVTLALGDNVLACSASFSHKDRFKDYSVLGQRSGWGDTVYGLAAAQPSGKSTDSYIKRYRPLTIVADKPVDIGGARTRAEWERNVRYGRSQSIAYTVQGWTYAPGKLWPINRLIQVWDKFLGFEEVERLITGVTFTLDANGTRTELALMPREAFELIPLPEPGADAQWDAI